MTRLSALPLLLVAHPALAQGVAHSGEVHGRTAPELSDVALFVLACAGVWLARRAMRARMRRSKD